MLFDSSTFIACRGCQAAILAGGTVTRLGYLTEDIPCIFCFMYGGLYLLADFPVVIRYLESQFKLALMTVYKNNDRFGKSNTTVEGNLISRYYKQLAGREHAEEPRYK